MHGVTRIIVFCTLTTVLPTMLLVIPLYLRHSLYANIVYTVAESDILEIDDGISTIFCSEQTLKMNTPFHAFKVSQRPEIASYRKRIQLKKSMTLPDDTLEYWGFYLLKGATVALSVCSRFQGASILIVRGERSLRTCGMMDHNKNKREFKEKNHLPISNQEIKVTVQSTAKEIDSLELINHEKTSKTMVSNWNYTSMDSNNESLPLFSDYNNIVRSNTDQENQINNREKESNYKKKVNSSESSKPHNTIDSQLNFLKEVAINHIQKHTAVSNTSRRGIEKLRHMRKKLEKLINAKKNNTSTENSKYNEKSKSQDDDGDDNKHVTKRETRIDDPESYSERKRRIQKLEKELNSDPEIIFDDDNDDEDENNHNRNKRNQNTLNPKLLFDRGVEHGGNAINFTNINDEDSSVSSFESGLLTCYDGQVLLTQQFEPSELCTNVNFLLNSKRIHTQHQVIESGYYYYIFYSDNDYVSNDMHAVFDIYKPTFQFENVSQSCINQTECSFTIGLLSDDHVIVEVPTKNGIDAAEDDITLLTSTCRPRMGIYTIFPIAVLLLVLGCAFV